MDLPSFITHKSVEEQCPRLNHLFQEHIPAKSRGTPILVLSPLSLFYMESLVVSFLCVNPFIQSSIHPVLYFQPVITFGKTDEISGNLVQSHVTTNHSLTINSVLLPPVTSICQLCEFPTCYDFSDITVTFPWSLTCHRQMLPLYQSNFTLCLEQYSVWAVFTPSFCL